MRPILFTVTRWSWQAYTRKSTASAPAAPEAEAEAEPVPVEESVSEV